MIENGKKLIEFTDNYNIIIDYLMIVINFENSAKIHHIY